MVESEMVESLESSKIEVSGASIASPSLTPIGPSTFGVPEVDDHVTGSENAKDGISDDPVVGPTMQTLPNASGVIGKTEVMGPNIKPPLETIADVGADNKMSLVTVPADTAVGALHSETVTMLLGSSDGADTEPPLETIPDASANIETTVVWY
jgi:hypothetical protein